MTVSELIARLSELPNLPVVIPSDEAIRLFGPETDFTAYDRSND